MKSEESLTERILAAIEFGDDAEDLAALINRYLQEAGIAGGDAAFSQIGIDASEKMVELVNEQAVQFARDRAAEMVGKKWVDDELVDNPNAEWRIDEATRDLLRGTIEEAVAQGSSNDEVAKLIEESYAFSEERSMVIARTETAFADVAGNLAAYDASGVVEGKQWLASEGCCDDCQELDGEIVALDEDFPGGVEGAPLHPNCECDVLPVLADEQ